VIKQHNAKRLRAGMAATALLALGLGVARPGAVAASNGAAQPPTGLLAAITTAAGQTYSGALQFATEMRSLYNVYQLQASEKTFAVQLTAEGSTEEANLLLCEIFNKVPAASKRKCRT